MLCWCVALSFLFLALPSVLSYARPEHFSTGYGTSEDSSLIVRTTKGLVRGQRVQSPTGKTVDQFLAIPYGKPPVGKYRFRHPRPVDPWDDIFNATSPPNSCYQINDTTFGENFPGTNIWNPNTFMSEDCLNLNVWVPYPRPTNGAVLLWIFGGGFYSGTIGLSLYDGRTLVSEENIILVEINYRIANLGFLYLEKARNDAPGNAGLFDQVMGMQWVHDNIHYFGGNPHNVTLFGESAGAVSISFHLLSPLSRNLFSQAILQSGAPTMPWGVTDAKKINQRSLQLAQYVGCPHDEDHIEDVIECLRITHPVDLINNETNDNFGVVEFTFTPIIDGVYLDESPEKLLENHDFKRTRLMMGSNREEGTYFIIYYLTSLFKNSEDVYLTREDFIKSVYEVTPNMSPTEREAIIYEYTDWLNPDDPISNRDAIDKIVGDYYFTCHVNKLGEIYSSVGEQVYMYYFLHRSTQNPWPQWMGTMHGDEINFIFGEPLNSALGYNNDEIALSRRMMKSWANFAKTGNPTTNEKGQWNHAFWPLYSKTRKEYFTFAVNTTEIGNGPRTKQCAFWQIYLPQLTKEIAKYSHFKSMCTNAAVSVSPPPSGMSLFALLLSAMLAILLNTAQ